MERTSWRGHGGVAREGSGVMILSEQTVTQLQKEWQAINRKSVEVNIDKFRFAAQLRDIKDELQNYPAEFDGLLEQIGNPSTLREYIDNIRQYPLAELMQWAAQGITMNHLRTANRNAEVPLSHIEQAAREQWTADELLTHLRGTTPLVYRLNKLLAKFDDGVQISDRARELIAELKKELR